MSDNQHQPLIQMLLAAEGNVSHMYLDTRGFVTVGIGHMIANADAATRLPFVHEDGTSATVAEIIAEYAKIKEQDPAHLASYYTQFCQLHLKPEDVLAILDRDIDDTERGVSTRFRNYYDYPHGPQDALLDMGFNLGVGGLTKYVKLRLAAERKDWRACADECHRNGISDERNAATRVLFLTAAESA